MFLSVGQKFLKKDQETNTITEVYRVISNKDRNYYRVMPVIPEGKSRLIRREVVDNEYFVPETHAKLFIAIYETDKGNDAIIVSLSNLDDDLPFYIARHEGNTFKHSSYGDTPNEGYLEKYYDIVYGLGDIKSRLDIDLYLNDSEDMILSLVSLDFDITNKMVELIESTGLKLDTKKQYMSKLLYDIKFMYWFHLAFNVHKVLFTIDKGDKHLNGGDLFVVEAIAQERFIDYTVVEYYHDINIYNITGNFLFISDDNDRVFVVKYVPASSLPGIVL